MQEFQYLRPETLEEAVALLDQYGKRLKVLAGGTDLIVALRDHAVTCEYIMDIKAIKELQSISYSECEGLSIGAAVNLNGVLSSDHVQNHYPLLAEAAKMLANSLLRNRATFIGNICNASPGGDMLSPSLVLEGRVEVASKQEIRCMELKEFFLGVKKTALKENEMVTKILFPSIKGKGQFLRKSRIKGHDLAQINVAAFLKEDKGLKICIGAAGPTPILVEDFESLSKADIQNSMQQIVEKVLMEIKPISDQRASKEFRAAMVGYLTRKALAELVKEVAS